MLLSRLSSTPRHHGRARNRPTTAKKVTPSATRATPVQGRSTERRRAVQVTRRWARAARAGPPFLQGRTIGSHSGIVRGTWGSRGRSDRCTDPDGGTTWPAGRERGRLDRPAAARRRPAGRRPARRRLDGRGPGHQLRRHAPGRPAGLPDRPGRRPVRRGHRVGPEPLDPAGRRRGHGGGPRHRHRRARAQPAGAGSGAGPGGQHAGAGRPGGRGAGRAVRRLRRGAAGHHAGRAAAHGVGRVRRQGERGARPLDQRGPLPGRVRRRPDRRLGDRHRRLHPGGQPGAERAARLPRGRARPALGVLVRASRRRPRPVGGDQGGAGRLPGLRAHGQVHVPQGRQLDLDRRRALAGARRRRDPAVRRRHGRGHHRAPSPAGPVAPPGSARSAHRPAQPHPVLRAAGRRCWPSRTARWGCATWTWTGSRRSTTPSATTSATSC